MSQEVQKERTTWKEIKEALQLLTKTGILFYVSDHPEQLSRKSIPEENLPSRAKKREQEEHKVEEFLFSGSGLKGIKSMLSVDFSINTNSTLWTKENYIVPYIEECFLDYSGEGAVLYNKDGERFVNELLPRDVVTKAIREQMEKDGTDHVWLSMENIDKNTILEHFPNICERCREEGYDVTKEWIPV